MNSDRMWGIGLLVVGLMLLVTGFGGIFGAPVFALGILVLVLMSVYNNLQSASNDRALRQYHDKRRTKNSYTASPQINFDEESQDYVRPHALDAVRRAGLDPEQTQILTVDIGIMVYQDQKNPQVCRRAWLPDDCDYIQPFIEIRLPTQATGKVKFEILDYSYTPLFIHEDYFVLERGKNFLTPASRLPIHDGLPLDDRWYLRVSADNIIIAEHRFAFEESQSAKVRQVIGEDGELTAELRMVMDDSNVEQNMSIDDLLSFQEEQRLTK